LARFPQRSNIDDRSIFRQVNLEENYGWLSILELAF
jgi:hypothetical protein